MGENRKIGSKPAPFVRTENRGMFTNSGPFIGVIKNNIDPTCAGRLQVYIPQYGGPDENNPGNWITVSYASPFRGQTRQRIDLSSYIDPNVDNTTTEAYQENSFQSYGFWFVPPDLNGRVLCFFANGDPSQGYWTSCIQDAMDAHMVPAIGAVGAASTNNPVGGGYLWQPDLLVSHAMLRPYIEIKSDTGSTEIPSRLPVSEPVLSSRANSSPNTPYDVKMYPHVYQTKQLGIQGLAFDYIRGSTSASSVRENPSQVFGISTPGRLTSFANVQLSEKIISDVSNLLNSSETITPDSSSLAQSLTKSLGCTFRTGGHQFVMDDGNTAGYEQDIRIRTTAGNQILMDDTNGQIYIINSPGTAWVELSPSGYIDIYSANDFSVHSQGNVNFHADKNINFNAGGAVRIHSGDSMTLDSSSEFTTRSTSGMVLYDTSGIQIGSGGSFTVGSSSFNTSGTNLWNMMGSIQLNLPGGNTPKDPGAIQQQNQILVEKQKSGQAWWQTGTYKSIVNRSPAHEPWPGHEVNGISATTPQGTSTGNPINRPQTGATMSGVAGTSIGNTINESAIAAQPPTGPLCGLTVDETRAFLAAIGHVESSWPLNSPGQGGTTSWVLGNRGKGYYAVNTIGYTGKYQFGAAALETYYFMKPGSSKQGTTAQSIPNDSNWTGYMGCHSVVDFMNNPTAQEALIMLMMKANCSLLSKWGIITTNSSPEEIAGYLGVCQLLGAGGCLSYYRTLHPNSTLYNAPTKTFATSDAYGSGAQNYFNICSNAIQISSSQSSA